MEKKARAIFIDRDGTLIKDEGYACAFSDALVFDFSIDAVKQINYRGYHAVIVTNQSAVARGICTLEQVEKFHREMIKFFQRKGARISQVYYCPYHEKGVVEDYVKSSTLRKPQPGMLLKAAEDFQLDLPDCIMIGDSTSDILAGKNAGCKTALVMTGLGETTRIDLEKKNIYPDMVAENLKEAVNIIFDTPVE